MTTVLPAFVDLPDLAGERFGSTVIAANDEFFAPKEGLIKANAPEWREGVYTERGKWMDGWETRRRRTPGYDWAIVRLGLPGVVRGVVIDTSFFTGNYPPRASLEACSILGTPSTDALTGGETAWWSLLESVDLDGNTKNHFPIEKSERVTHVRLNIVPDGGVARLRLHGDVQPDPRIFAPDHDVDLAAMSNAGFVVACSDMHYGHRQNLILPDRSTHMGDGWETKRRRGPGHDWTIVRLGRRGSVQRIELDTDHFKGNAPGSCMLEYCDAHATAGASVFEPDAEQWRTLLPESALQPHTRHIFESVAPNAATHVRLNIYPDGGVARLRLIGRATST
ncbi:MAG TPA: allantoicase [Gemmatimonadaceae bacterium]|nr:allantoicase [Gemmatimonadaceae bacterium]